jgi:hypothetical protein
VLFSWFLTLEPWFLRYSSSKRETSLPGTTNELAHGPGAKYRKADRHTGVPLIPRDTVATWYACGWSRPLRGRAHVRATGPIPAATPSPTPRTIATPSDERDATSAGGTLPVVVVSDRRDSWIMGKFRILRR